VLVEAALRPRRFRALAHEVALWRPDAIHLAFGEGYPGAYLLARELRRRRIPFSVTWHDPDPHGGRLSEIPHHVLARRVLAGAALVHVHGERWVPAARRLAPRASVVVAELPALSCDACPLVDPPRPRGDDIVWFGRFETYRGAADLAVALERYWALGGRRRAVVAGHGDVPPAVAALASREPRLRLELGWRTHRQLHGLLLDSGVLCLPYRTGTQSAGPWWGVLHGCHLVVSDVGEIGALARRLGGTVVPPEDPIRLAEALLQLDDLAPAPLPADVRLPTFDPLIAALLPEPPTA
jgi:glycosyltransferase involved in cell wall biosynthesis